MSDATLPLAYSGDSLLQGMAVIEAGGVETVLVVEGDFLVGILTDGDVRRAILSGHNLETPLERVMQRQYTAVGPSFSRVAALDLMKARAFNIIPIVSDAGRLLGVHLLRDLLGCVERPNAAMILCGGQGLRLRPITERVPKPLIPVAGRPILEHIILHLMGYGFREFHLAIHYRGEMVESHFGDGGAFGCRISYLKEEQPLGTGGALALLPPQEHPLLVMNGDLVTQFDAAQLLEAHSEQQNHATVGAITYVHQVPFGVLETEGSRVRHITEKPNTEFRVNAGVYVLDPEIPRRVPFGRRITLPEILENCLMRGERVGCHCIDQEWIDVGCRDELLKAMGQG